MSDSKVIRISEVANDRPFVTKYLSQPSRSLDQIAIAQELAVKARAPQSDNYRDAIQLLRDLYARDDFRCSMSNEDRKRVEEIVLKAGGF